MRFYLSRRTGLAHGDKAGLIAAWSLGGRPRKRRRSRVTRSPLSPDLMRRALCSS